MEETKKIKKTTIIIILIAIILIQVLARIYVGLKKEYFHIDEAYSYALMNYDKIQITENEDFYGNWHTKDYYIDYLSVNEDEKWDLKPVYENQKNDVHPPLYYLLLRIAATFTINDFTKWTGIILNIIISIFSTILVYFIANILFKNQKMALLTCFVAGLTLGALDTTAYIRMYELANLFVLLITYFHLRIYHKKDVQIKDLVFIGISILLGSLTHYYVIIYTAFLFILFVIKYISTKEYKNLRNYTICFVLAASVSILIFPHSLRHIFSGYRGQEAQSNLLNVESLVNNIAIYTSIILKNLFGGLGIFIIAVYIILYIKKRKDMVAQENKEINLLLIPTIVYFILVAQISSYKELRYIMPIISIAMICVIYMFYKLFKQYVSTKKAEIMVTIMAVLIIMAPILTNSHLDFTYTKMNHLADKMEEKSSIPTLYILNEDNIRFLDDIYIFTKLDESYIMKYSQASIENIQEALKDKDTSNGIIFVYNRDVKPEKILEEVKQTYNYQTEEDIQNLNSGKVKYLY